MPRRFQVERPDQLLILQDYVKDGNLTRTASIWNTARNRKGDKGTSWDGKIFVTFRTVDGARMATVDRAIVIKCPPTMGKSEIRHPEKPPYEFAHLRYNPALQWCKDHLQEIK